MADADISLAPIYPAAIPALVKPTADKTIGAATTLTAPTAKAIGMSVRASVAIKYNLLSQHNIHVHLFECVAFLFKSHTHTPTHTYTNTYVHTPTQTHTYTHTYTQNVHTHTYTHTHTHDIFLDEIFQSFLKDTHS